MTKHEIEKRFAEHSNMLRTKLNARLGRFIAEAKKIRGELVAKNQYLIVGTGITFSLDAIVIAMVISSAIMLPFLAYEIWRRHKP